MLRVVAGNPTQEETAVVVAVLSAIAAGSAPRPAPTGLDAWRERSRLLGVRPAPGPNTWRITGLPT